MPDACGSTLTSYNTSYQSNQLVAVLHIRAGSLCPPPPTPAPTPLAPASSPTPPTPILSPSTTAPSPSPATIPIPTPSCNVSAPPSGSFICVGLLWYTP